MLPELEKLNNPLVFNILNLSNQAKPVATIPR